MDCSTCGETLPDEAPTCPACGDVTQARPGKLTPPFRDYLNPNPSHAEQGWVQYRQKICSEAVASLVLSILVIFGIGSVLAIIYGYRARRKIAATDGWLLGDGLARAGIIIGWVGLVLVVTAGLAMGAIRF